MENTVENAIRFLKDGKFIILADNESRENEGDLVALGDRIKPEIVYQMLKIANGLMCVPINSKIAKRLGFKEMVEHSTDPNETPFMVTTDATFESTGVTTGVSAYIGQQPLEKLRIPHRNRNNLTIQDIFNRLLLKIKVSESGMVIPRQPLT